MSTANSTIEKLAENVDAVTTEVMRSLTAEREARERMQGRLDELATIVGRHTLLTGGGDPGASEVARIDPSYFNPFNGRILPNATAAKALGHFVMAVITGNAKSRSFLDKKGVPFVRVEDDKSRAGSVSDDELGGYTIPSEFGGAIIAAMPQYGVFARYAEVEPMVRDRKVFAKDANDLELYPLDEHQEIPELDANYQQVTLHAKLFGAFARWSADLDEYSMENIGESWARRFARAAARKQDQCGFKGDGTKTYSNMLGILANPDVGTLSLPAGKTAFSDLAYDNILGLMGSIPAAIYEEGNTRFFMDSSINWLLATLKDGDGRHVFMPPTEGATSAILGSPVTRTTMMPKIGDSAAGKPIMAFGDLRRAYKLGVHTQMSLLFSEHVFFRQGQKALRILSRFGVKSVWANGITVLKTADA
jgi:HK97 family phage major capsid protein